MRNYVPLMCHHQIGRLSNEVWDVGKWNLPDFLSPICVEGEGTFLCHQVVPYNGFGQCSLSPFTANGDVEGFEPPTD